ncbi:YceI family protein [Asticcacaulis tiandongensis]|uniref:YceI family protein n=1 Tax=Asticcacaulis tiandongensis TaxID=2565365 RepID=UPI00112B76B1|nr:YceI family protein [Asticcacaulis tiandongensis]
MQPVTYHRFSRYLHWIMAALLFYMVFLGWSFDSDDSGRFARFQLHKSVGILILFLTVLRIGLREAYKAPPELPGPKWQTGAAKAVHIGFYVLMIGLPISGWAVVSASTLKIPTELFGVIPWPHLPVDVSEVSHDRFANLHGLLAKLLIYLLIPLHVGAALMHHFIHKDEAITRMLPGLEPKPSIVASLLNWRWIVPLVIVVGAFAAAFGLLHGAPSSPVEPAVSEITDAPGQASSEGEAEAVSAVSSVSVSTEEEVASSTASEARVEVPVWSVDKAASHIRFKTSFQGASVNGGFSAYQARIVFDPQQLDRSSVKVTIDLTSVSTSDADRDSTLKSSSFFDVTNHPQAVFEARRFTASGGNKYIARGKLTLHGQTRDFDLPFTLDISDKTANVAATATLDRLAFGVGSGEWASTSAIPADVTLDIKLKADTK